VFISTPYVNQKETALHTYDTPVSYIPQHMHPLLESDKILRQSGTKHYTNLLNTFKIQILYMLHKIQRQTFYIWSAVF
jgi:hypothetical protein